jgi:Pup amidohydrolase
MPLRTFRQLIGFEIETGGHIVTPIDSPVISTQPTAGELLYSTYRKHLAHRLGGFHDGPGVDEFSAGRFRFCLGHGHARISSPLVFDAFDLVLWQRRARRFVRSCRRLAERDHGLRLCVHYANTSRFGTAWGFHLNALVLRWVFDAWRDAGWQPLFGQWVPYAVTSQVLFGTGKVSTENGRPSAGFQLSQRADFVDRLIGDDTVLSKPLIDTRDEALADPGRFARFHIAAVFDCNLCEFSTWLKLGVTQVMLVMLQAGLELPDLRLKYPLTNLTGISRDEQLSLPLELVNGRTLTALDIQETLASAAERAARKGVFPDSAVPSAREIISFWLDSIRRLRRNDPQLRRRLDWVVKKHGLEKLRASPGVSSDDPRLTHLDLQYAADGGWFEILEREHLVDCIEDVLPGHRHSCRLASTARDVARARILRKFSKDVRRVDWNYVDLSVSDGVDSRECRIFLDDQLNDSDLMPRIEAAATASQLIGLLRRQNPRPVGRSHLPERIDGQV